MRSPRLFFRMNSHQYSRTLFMMFLLVCVTMVMFVIIPNCKPTYLSVNSWRNVSMLQLLKMHLSGHPSHVTSLSQSECQTLSVPYVNKSLLNFDQVNFYEDVEMKIKNLNSSEKWKESFRPLLNREAKMTLLHLYAVFQQALDLAGISHILMHGSAIGAWRHHGVTPWDDDIDIAIDSADWSKTRQVLSCIEGYTLDAASNSKWAFFKSDSPLILDGPKRFPFLDLFLYTHDDNYVWALNYVHLRKFVFSKEDMFPPQFVPFECFLSPVPRHLRKVLEHQYIHPEICTSHYTDHKSGIAKKQVTKPCKELSDIYKIFDTHN